MINLLLSLMSNRWLAWSLLLISLFCYYQLMQNNAQLNETNKALTMSLNTKERVISHLQQQNSNHQQALLEQKRLVQQADKLQQAYSQKLKARQYENEQLRQWLAASLPNDVKWLFTRPDIINSGDYREWMSHRHTMLPASQ